MDLEKLALEAEENLKDIFADIDRTAYQNTARVIDSFREHRVDESCFAGTSGYGHDDKGRDTLDAIYADVFGARVRVRQTLYLERNARYNDRALRSSASERRDARNYRQAV